jgi:hypothetical protein
VYVSCVPVFVFTLGGGGRTQVLLVAMSFMSIIVYMLGALIFILFSTDLSSIQIKGTCRSPPAWPGFLDLCSGPWRQRWQVMVAGGAHIPARCVRACDPPSDGQVVGLGGITMGTVVAFSSYIGRYVPLHQATRRRTFSSSFYFVYSRRRGSDLWPYP